ncbi:protein yellow-like [Cylas formicarius]|uniref:protein yellow-like n=1 Tax=Cylas formicarius TaxID=197179 RepID=UPI0029589D8C|nr:protein yellow-like [Cylas formicarius]
MLVAKVFVVLVCAATTVKAIAKLEEVFAWKQVTFTWPSAETEKIAKEEGDYEPKNNLPLGLARWKDKLFVTVPRWKSGVAATLGYVSLNEPINKTAAITPYPDWKAHILPKNDSKPDPNTLVSIFRVAVDKCDRLWAMDTGLADILGNPKQVLPPSIAIFDLNTDKLIRRYTIKSDWVSEDAFFANIEVDVKGDRCDEAFAYLPNLGSYELVVYSFQEDDSWRFKHNFFHFDPLKGDFNVSGVNFQWSDGIFSIALGPEEPNGYRTAYFHALASLNEFSVNTEVLQNQTLAADPHNYHLFKLEGSKGENSQTASSVFDQQSNVLFVSQQNKDGVACWNPKKPLNPQNVPLIIEDHEKLVFINDLKIDADRNLWILSDKLSHFLYRELSPEEVNYRILKIKVDDAIEGSICKV